MFTIFSTENYLKSNGFLMAHDKSLKVIRLFLYCTYTTIVETCKVVPNLLAENHLNHRNKSFYIKLICIHVQHRCKKLLLFALFEDIRQSCIQY